ncbi:MAG: hypothetical protein GIKADHBN_03475 [Phycisphaerales bacterium]|nr:hypothetical protein [Phycisphaerales bacterium]
MKQYSIRPAGGRFDRELFEEGLARAMAGLPQPAQASGRCGAGFVIMHQGASMLYVVCCRWENENEQVTEVLVKDLAPGSAWRRAANESWCVWDLEVMWFERNAFVETMLAPAAPDVGAYLRKTITVEA